MAPVPASDSFSTLLIIRHDVAFRTVGTARCTPVHIELNAQRANTSRTLACPRLLGHAFIPQTVNFFQVSSDVMIAVVGGVLMLSLGRKTAVR